jgi:hypothetical protein
MRFFYHSLTATMTGWYSGYETKDGLANFYFELYIGGYQKWLDDIGLYSKNWKSYLDLDSDERCQKCKSVSTPLRKQLLLEFSGSVTPNLIKTNNSKKKMKFFPEKLKWFWYLSMHSVYNTPLIWDQKAAQLSYNLGCVAQW